MEETNINLFEIYLREAEGDPPSEEPADNNDPPDLGASEDSEEITDEAPDLGDDPFSVSDNSEDENNNDENNEEDNENLPLDEKISAIMNLKLYQRFLNLLNTVGNQISMIKNNNDILYSISNNSLDVLEELKRLDENIRLYLINYFNNENYSKNLLFFNKILNLLKLLNDEFNQKISKGIRAHKQP
jgi:hypothetical protein